MSASDRVGSWFVAPSPAAGRTEWVREAAAPGPFVGLLAVDAGTGPLAAVLALALVRETGAPFAVVLDWGGGVSPVGAALAVPAVRRMVRSLAAHGVTAVARGRLAWVTLPVDEEAAVAAAHRALSATPGGIPVVVGLGRPRTTALDGLIAELDAVVVAAAEDDVCGAVAVHGVAPVARRIVRWPDRPTPLLRRLAHAGIDAGARRCVPAEVRR